MAESWRNSRTGKYTLDDRSSIKKKIKPNCFIGLPICNKTILQHYLDVQNKLVEQDPNSKEFLCSPQQLHITLFVLYIGDEESMKRAVLALQQAAKNVTDLLSNSPIKLKFKGLGRFGKKVLFSKLEDDFDMKVLTSVYDTVSEAFAEKDIELKENKGFTPHMTIAKTSYPNVRNALYHATSNEFMDQFQSTVFGEDEIGCLQLLSMEKPVTEDGYYFKEGEFSFITANEQM